MKEYSLQELHNIMNSAMHTAEVARASSARMVHVVDIAAMAKTQAHMAYSKTEHNLQEAIKSELIAREIAKNAEDVAKSAYDMYQTEKDRISHE